MSSQPTETTLEEYLADYGPQLVDRLKDRVKPLHTPGEDPLIDVELLREPFPAQAHVITAMVRGMRETRASWLIGEMGVGKTTVGAAAVHAEAAGRDYRAIVVSPPHLVSKWKREILETVPYCSATIVTKYKQLIELQRTRPKPSGAEFIVVSSSVSKMGTSWRPVFEKVGEGYRHADTTARYGFPLCVDCKHPIYDKKEDDEGGSLPMPIEKLKRKQHACENCGAPLWTWIGNFDRWPVATFINKRLRGMFDYLIVDEAHTAKAESSAIANAVSKLSSACHYTILLTGTLLGGYATDIHGLLWRTAPYTVAKSGLRFKDRFAFAQQYGRIEKTQTEKESNDSSNRQSKGSSTRTSVKVRPGVMPNLFGEHLMDKAVFLSLDEVSVDLPPLEESVIDCQMDAAQAKAYRVIEDAFKNNIKEMMKSRSGRQAMSRMVQMMLGYADHPHGWDPVGFCYDDDDSGSWVDICEPASLDPELMRPKEDDLVEAIIQEHVQERQVWIYTQMTRTRDVQPRLQQLLEERGLRVKILRSHAVPTNKREAWIKEHGKDADVMISHPRLVETGLDLFDKSGSHNFSTVMFYQTGTSLFTLRQAARRAWRIGQTLDCRIKYFYYAASMQQRMMDLMCRKLVAAESIEGRFSSEGLAGMTQDSDSVTMELAKSLAQSIDANAGIRKWEKMKSS